MILDEANLNKTTSTCMVYIRLIQCSQKINETECWKTVTTLSHLYCYNFVTTLSLCQKMYAKFLTQPKLSMFISKSTFVVSPVQKKIYRAVDSSLKNLSVQKIWMTFSVIAFNLLIEPLTWLWVAQEAPLAPVPERETNFIVHNIKF